MWLWKLLLTITLTKTQFLFFIYLYQLRNSIYRSNLKNEPFPDSKEGAGATAFRYVWNYQALLNDDTLGKD